jgi:hypothetical protein
MRKEITYVSVEKFSAIATSLGLAWNEQKGFVKLSGAAGRNVYVGKTKRVGRVDISGFEMEGEGYVNLGELAFGAVKQQVDFTRGEDEILAAFTQALTHMLSLDARIKPKAAKAPAGLKAGETAAKLETEEPAVTQARTEAIKNRASRRAAKTLEVATVIGDAQ